MDCPQVVIVDDNGSLRDMLRRLVEGMNGQVLGEAEDGRTGVLPPSASIRMCSFWIYRCRK